MAEPFLVRPTIQYKTSCIEALHEFLAEGQKPGWNFDKLEHHFDDYVQVLLERETDPLPGYVPQSDYWLIAEGVFAGQISIRHNLNDSLLHFGGHIGYQIRPSMRGKGYGRLQLKLALEKARALGLGRVLITCDDDNNGSIKIIESNGGVIDNKVDNGRASLTRRYWIALD